MSASNVLPSTPPEIKTQSVLYSNLYPNLTQRPQDFRIGKVNQIASALAQEVVHYRLVR